MRSRRVNHIARAIQIEQRLMEGSYRKVLQEAKKLGSRYYRYFHKKLIKSVRERIMEYFPSAYHQEMGDDEIRAALLLDRIENVREWRGSKTDCKMREYEGHATFGDKKKVCIELLEYATELEKII
mmetsp:Transcript_30956/g.75481  ORF Transcript_30956/g.75481 Transcript_30956/m.75481 type:complete len:126 (-) Transcript_30956:181-558(-)